MLKSVRFGFMLLDFIEQSYWDNSIRAEQFSYRFIFSLLSALLTFSRSLFVSEERKECNVSIVLSTGSCVSGSSRIL